MIHYNGPRTPKASTINSRISLFLSLIFGQSCLSEHLPKKIIHFLYVNPHKPLDKYINLHRFSTIFIFPIQCFFFLNNPIQCYILRTKGVVQNPIFSIIHNVFAEVYLVMVLLFGTEVKINLLLSIF